MGPESGGRGEVPHHSHLVAAAHDGGHCVRGTCHALSAAQVTVEVGHYV